MAKIAERLIQQMADTEEIARSGHVIGGERSWLWNPVYVAGERSMQPLRSTPLCN